MIEHISLRCRDARASRKFYEQALAPLGYGVDREYGDAFGFVQGGRHDFWVTKGKVGTPTHVAFHADAPSTVDAFYAAAIEAGGKDNGGPGIRADYGYAAFVLDPDGSCRKRHEPPPKPKALSRHEPPAQSGRKRSSGAARNDSCHGDCEGD